MRSLEELVRTLGCEAARRTNHRASECVLNQHPKRANRKSGFDSIEMLHRFAKLL